MIAAFERATGLGVREQVPAWIVGIGHGATHWIAATFYLLLPFLADDLGLSFTEMGVLVTSLHICSFAANFGSGMVVDVLGRRVLVQVISLTVGAAALMMFGTSTSFFALVVFVGIIGATNNLWHPAAISFLSGSFQNNRGYVLSIHTQGATIGDILAPLCIGALMVNLSWQEAAIWGGGPVLLVAVVIMISLMRMDKPDNASVARRITFGEYIGGLKHMFTNKAAMGLCLMAGFRSMTQNGLLIYIPVYIKNVLGGGPQMVGLGMMAMQLGGLISGPIAGIWSDRTGRRPVVIAAATGTTIVVPFLAFVPNEYFFIAGVSVLGFVLFALRPVIHSWMMDLTPAKMHGTATSALFGTQTALTLPMPVMAGWIADSYGISAVFYFLAGTMVIANVIVVMLPNAEKIEE